MQSFPPFDQAAVLVVGDVMLDRYWYGSTSRISPEAPVPVIRVTRTDDRPGGAANVALNIAALGAPAYLLGVTGQDEAAAALEQQLHSVGVSTSFIRQAQQPTIVKLRAMSRQQQLLRMDFEEQFQVPVQDLLEQINSLLPQVQVMILSDYGKGSLSGHQQLIAAARAKNVKVLVDPKGTDFSIYRGASLLTPNLAEFEAVMGACNDEADILAKGQQLLQQLELEALLITRGEQGMTLLRPQQQALHLPAQAREVFDVTGAGDTVISTLATALASGEDLAHAMYMANLAAGIVVGKLGTSTISAPELRRALQGENSIGRGVLGLEQLQAAVAEAKARGERVVFTNGCFDILHAGHVHYLEQAREQGDRLIVAVNADASVKALKGPGRPINSVERRMAVLAGLGAVDWVTSFAEDTPENLLRLLQPEVLVKGGDYSEDQVVGAGIVRAYGGEVRVLGLVENSSTTAIVEKIRNKD